MKRMLSVLAAPLAIVGLAACDSDHHKHTATTVGTAPTATAPATPPPATTTTSKPAASSTVNIAADPSGQLKFTQSKLTATAGKVTVDFTNKAPVPHDVVLIDSASYSPSAKVLGKTPIFQGGTKSFTTTLTSGTYYFYCSVPGHRQAGMFGTVTVSGAAGSSTGASKTPSKHAATKKASKPAATKAKTAAKSAAAPAAAHTVNIAASPSGQLAFTQSQITTTAGKVTIDFANSAPEPHDVVLIDSAGYSPSAKVLGKTPIFQGGMKSFTVTLKSGTYYFYCSVPGHRQAGMYGTLTVS
jgi:plastocyanin